MAETSVPEPDETAPEPKPTPPPPAPSYIETGDLDAIEKHGVLRILTPPFDDDGLARQDIPIHAERAGAVRLAQHFGLEPRFVEVEDYNELISALVEGRGDLIAAHLTITPARSASVAFARSVQGVDEMIVGRNGAANPPTKVEDLAGRTVTVVVGSSFEETLRELQKSLVPTLKIEAVRGNEETILRRLVRGEVELTVTDSDTLAAVAAYTPDLRGHFEIAKDRRLATAVRKTNPKLLRQLNALMSVRAMQAYRDETSTDDLDGIKKRGVLRVLTRNNGINYFIYKGRELGFEYELARMFAEELGVRLQMVIPPKRQDLIPWLLEGRGDVIGASMTITAERAKKIAFTRPYLYSEELVVHHSDGPPVSVTSDLANKRFHVRASSSYRETLDALRPKYGPFEVVDVDEKLETAQILERVAKKEIPLTVADALIFKVEKAYTPDITAGLSLTAAAAGVEPDALSDEQRIQIAWGARPANTKLLAALNVFIAREYRGLRYNMLEKRYFESSRQTARAKSANLAASGRLSPYDEIIKKYSERYGFDWRLMAAQSFVESGFDPKATSWVGALGLFQVMPNTGAEMGFTNLQDPDQGIHAGIRYMNQLVNRLDPKIPLKHRLRFALAAYNAGLGHVYDAMRLAEEQGLDPDKWFGHTEKTMLLLSESKYARRAKHGYAQGGQPVAYVSHIQSLYEQYSALVAP